MANGEWRANGGRMANGEGEARRVSAGWGSPSCPPPLSLTHTNAHILCMQVPLEAYMLTWRGKPVAEAVEMGKSKVIGVGIGLLGGDDQVEEEGEFCLDLRRIEGIVI